MDEVPVKRRKFLVDPGLQIGLSTRMVVWLYVYFLLCAAACNAPALLTLPSAPPSSAAAQAASAELRSFARQVVVPLAMTFVAMAIHGVVLTHRIAGPVLRMKRFLGEVVARRLPAPIRLRRTDSLKDLADELNTAVAVLREDAARRRVLADAVLRSSQRLVATLERRDADPREALAQANAVLDAAETLSAHVDSSVSAGAGPAVPLVPVEPEADAEAGDPAAPTAPAPAAVAA